MKIFPIILLLLSNLIINAQPDWRMYRAPEQINDYHDFGDFFWLGTNAGLIEVDKETLEKTWMNSLESDLPSDDIHAVTVDQNGNPWIGTYDVVIGMWDGDDWVNVINVADQLPSVNFGNLHAISFDSDNVMWIGTSFGLVRYDGNTWEHFKTVINGNWFLNEVWDITFDGDGNMYVSSLHNFKFDGTEWTDLFDEAEIESSSDGFWFNLGQNDLWYSNLEDGIVHFDGTQWRTWSTDNLDDWNSNPPNSDIKGVAYNDIIGHFLITKSDGLYQLQNGAWNQNSIADFEDVTLFFSDNSEKLWLNRRNRFGKLTNWIYDETNLSQYKLEHNSIRKIVRNAEGYVYVVNGFRDIAYHNGTTWKALQTPFNDYPNLTIHDFIIDVNNPKKLYFATSHGLFVKENSDWSQLMPAGVSTNQNGLGMTPNGDLYLVHLDGLSVLSNGSWTHFNENNSPLDNNVFTVKFDKNGNIYVPMENKIFKYDGVNWTKFDNTNSPMSSSYFPLFEIDSEDNIWVRNPQEGLLKYDGTSWTIFNTANSEILSDDFHNLIADSDGKIYIGHQEGISIFDGTDWEILNHEDYPFYWDYQVALLKDNDGTLWIGQGENGLYAYNPEGVSVAVKEEKLEKIDSKIKVFPNPTSGILNIDLEDTLENGIEKIELYNSFGKLVESWNSIKENNQNNKLNIRNLPKGVYLLRIKNEHGFYTKKIVVN